MAGHDKDSLHLFLILRMSLSNRRPDSMNLNCAPKNAIPIENRTVQRTMLPRSAVALGIVCPMANEETKPYRSAKQY